MFECIMFQNTMFSGKYIWTGLDTSGEERREATVVSVRPGLTQIRTRRAGCCPIACGVRHV